MARVKFMDQSQTSHVFGGVNAASRRRETSYLAPSAREESEKSTAPPIACLRESVGDPLYFLRTLSLRSYSCAYLMSERN